MDIVRLRYHLYIEYHFNLNIFMFKNIAEWLASLPLIATVIVIVFFKTSYESYVKYM